ncbi:type III pantothenate kinase [Hymenobacter luteus]|uniref:Type III pantothenate kinase n=2 Tax=Hymenobacter TaxID=89966 RepID=A0A7W9T616_9BACT|nr:MULTISPECIES: type III pantothenate kinase [Hymenobacter]MBB4603358.1 type III pantothenate kinase [Hymenobacter latericoloratus]MBB6061084.1 type III pantothenate kinase [Hymenobacter luteus]
MSFRHLTILLPLTAGLVRTLALDIGNTAVKYGCFEADVLVESATGQTPEQVRAAVARLRPEHGVVASVAEPAAAWATELRPQIPGQVLEFAPATTPLPIANAYATPHTLGADRLAAAVGAAWLLPGRNVVIVDAGTAIKCDLVEGGHTFRGGSIAPGLAMRFQALHTFTGRLPLVSHLPNVEASVPLTGTDTESAIRSGVVNGAVAEVRGLLADYEAQYPGLAVVLAGGDAAFFRARLKGPIFVIPELVLIGLHRILVHHVST